MQHLQHELMACTHVSWDASSSCLIHACCEQTYKLLDTGVGALALVSVHSQVVDEPVGPADEAPAGQGQRVSSCKTTSDVQQQLVSCRAHAGCAEQLWSPGPSYSCKAFQMIKKQSAAQSRTLGGQSKLAPAARPFQVYYFQHRQRRTSWCKLLTHQSRRGQAQ